MDVLNYKRLAVPAIAAASLPEPWTYAYAADRTAFEVRLDVLGAVQAMVADIAADLLQTHLRYRHIAQLIDDRPTILDSSIGKLTGGRLANHPVDLAIQIHGGCSYTTNYEIERLYQDARPFTIGGGTSAIQTEDRRGTTAPATVLKQGSRTLT